jgi:hypothetical protein
LRPVLLHFEIAAGMLMAAAFAVKAAQGISRYLERSCLVWRVFRTTARIRIT